MLDEYSIGQRAAGSGQRKSLTPEPRSVTADANLSSGTEIR